MRHKVEDLTLFTIEQNVFSATKETIEELYLSSERNDNHESK